MLYTCDHSKSCYTPCHRDGPKRIAAGLEQLVATIVSSRAVTSQLSLASVHTLHIVTAVDMQRFNKAFIDSARWCPVETASFIRLLCCMPSLTALHITNDATIHWPLLPCLTGKLCWFPAVARPFVQLFAALRPLQLRALTIPGWASVECIGHLLDAHAFEQYQRTPYDDQDAFSTMCRRCRVRAVSLCSLAGGATPRGCKQAAGTIGPPIRLACTADATEATQYKGRTCHISTRTIHRAGGIDGPDRAQSNRHCANASHSNAF